jgi:MraZ protein
MKRVGLKREIILTAYNDRIEIWSKDDYLELMEGNMADFADLADEVMGEIPDTDAE